MKSFLAMSCALLLGLIWGLSHESSAQYCVEQPHDKESFIGESITIPCSFSYPEDLDPLSVSLSVKAANGNNYCGREVNEIYNSSTKNISSKYTGRLSVQLDPTLRTSSITIKDLKHEDGQMYCCRLRINVSEGHYSTWQHPSGTSIVVKGETEMILEQEFLILARPGDIVTIIARFTLKNQITTPNVTMCNVFRSSSSAGCGDSNNPVTCTQRINENIVFIKINTTDSLLDGFYCYSIKVSVGETNYTRRTNIGSQLLILQPRSMSKIKQTSEVEFSGPVIINCSFSIQDFISSLSVGNRKVLWTQVYWMMGEPREHFVYHPNEDYIHQNYKGKTKLIGHSDLLLEDFRDPDNTTLYCRVAIRFCLETTEQPNHIETLLEEGPGTILRVQEVSKSRVQTVIIASCVGCAVLLLLVLSVICLKTKKDKKRNNAGETIVETVDSAVRQNSAYENIKEVKNRATETDEKMVYATVKHSATATAKKSKEPEESEVVYATVKSQ